MSKKKTIFALVIAAMLVLSGTAAAIGGLTDQTETFGVVADDGSELRAHSAMVGVADSHVGGAQTIHVGQADQINRPGASAAIRLATEKSESNMTLVGPNVGVQYDYYNNIQDSEGDALFMTTARESTSITDLSRTIAEEHWTSASNIVVANPNRVKDFVGAAQYARTNDYPLVYANGDTYAELNSTIEALGATTVYMSENLDGDMKIDIGNDYTTNELATDNGATFVNGFTADTNEAFIVPDIQSAAAIQGAAEGTDVLVAENNSALGTSVTDYLEANADVNVVLVANEGEITAAMQDDVQDITSGSVDRLGSLSTSEELARLALYENGETNEPLVTVSDATYFNEDGTEVVQVKVRNIGFAEALNVNVELPREEGAEYTFTEGTPTSTEGPIVWEKSTLAANGTMTLTYEITGIEGDSRIIPEVTSYENSAGSSFQGMTIIATANEYIEDIKDRIEGYAATIASVGAGIFTLDPLVLGGIVGVIAMFGLAVLYFEEWR